MKDVSSPWRKLFFGSLLVNAGLAGTVLLALQVTPAITPPPPAAPASPAPPPVRKDAAASASHAVKFHWRELESTNYFQYVSNLRAIGCPEQTIRDLIQAELNSLYDSPAAPASPQRELEKSSLLVALVGPAPAAVAAPSVPSPAPDLHTRQLAVAQARREKFLTALGQLPLSSIAVQRAERIMDDYLAQVSNQPSPSADAPAPAFDLPDRHWSAAEQKIRALFGYQAFEVFQRQLRSSQ